jgi:alpha-glucosidase
MKHLTHIGHTIKNSFASHHYSIFKKMKKIIGLLFVLAIQLQYGSVTAQQKPVHIFSPNKQIDVKVFVFNKRLSYSIVFNRIPVVETSPLGLTLDNVDLGFDAKVVSMPSTSSIDYNYPIYGQHSIAHNYAREATIPVMTNGKKFDLIIRVYNDGVGIRYTIPEDSKYINKESTSWNLPAKTTQVAWSAYSTCYENLSHVTPLDSVPNKETIMGPLTFNANGLFVSISEADCENFSDMAFLREGNLITACFPFAEAGWLLQLPANGESSVLNGLYKGQKVTPWRTTIISKNLTGLINSDLLMNLSPPPVKGSDFSWVKPGRCLWQWWSVGAPKYEEQKEWYNAAAKLKWEYYLIDDGWRNWRQPGKDQWELLREVIAYGKSMGVKTLVWVDSKEMRSAPERRLYLQRIKESGASGIKIDFIPNATASIMQWYMGTMQDCVELKLLLNFHGSVKPTGLTRTYPMAITREAVRGDEYHMSRYNRIAPFEQDVSLPFTRLMAGAADITPVMLNPEELTSRKFTWAHEFAQSIVFLSPITHFADQYKFYLESPMFDLFQDVPTTWDETRVLDCTKMGKVVAFARRKGHTWWIGVMNGAGETEITIPLNFLQKSTTGTLIYDGATNTSVSRKTAILTPKDTIILKLNPGGGFVARF